MIGAQVEHGFKFAADKIVRVLDAHDAGWDGARQNRRELIVDIDDLVFAVTTSTDLNQIGRMLDLLMAGLRLPSPPASNAGPPPRR